MAGGEARERWRDEDSGPSPAEEFGPTDWWLKYERDTELYSFPPDHGHYLRELYDEIAELRLEREALKAELAAARERAAA